MILPDPKKVLWRYIDLENFNDMLETRSLFFCRTIKFSDPFKVDINKIIDKVILPPTADEKVQEKVKQIMIRNKYTCALSYSRLKEEPYY